jgi:predicted nucleic acid-binding protein
MTYLPDTCTCIDVLRGRTMTIGKLSQVSPGECSISTITIYELYSGVEQCRNPKNERKKVD